jgi:DNA-binding response OmpR family regulator
MKILIIEDDPAFAQSIREYLEKDGCRCEIADRFVHAIRMANMYDYDCILVDITLPGGNGLDIIREMKQTRNKAGIIVISAKNSVDDKIAGLSLGADDYLAKPFHLSELNARIKALIRRKQHSGDAILTFGSIIVHPDRREVYIAGNSISLTRSEFDLLLYFIVNRNRVITRESLAEHLIGEQVDHVQDFKFIYWHIKNLRKKIMEAGGDDYIKAIYGIGYKLTLE